MKHYDPTRQPNNQTAIPPSTPAYTSPRHAILLGAAFSLLTAMAPPAYPSERSIDDLIAQSKARQERLRASMRPAVEASVTYPSTPSGQVESSPKNPDPGQSAPKHDSGLSLDMKAVHNPTVEKNIENYTLGPYQVQRRYDTKTGKLSGTGVYIRPMENLGLYGFEDPKGKWHIGPTLRMKEGDVSASIDLTDTESSLYLDIDGYRAGPLNFKNPKALDLQWKHALNYNLASGAVEIIAGRDARKSAQKAYTVYQVLEHPTPLAFAIQVPGAIKAHKRERGFFRKLLKTAAHVLTLGAFCDRRE